jgi:ABC-type transport system substrate-binding protein
MTARRLLYLSLVLAVVAGLALAVVGCGTSGGGGAGPSAAGGSSPKQGGTLKVGYEGEPTGLDPAVAYENLAWDIENMLYNGLLKYASGEGEAGTKIVPDLAAGMPTVSADAKTYTFKLTQGVKFAAPVNREVTVDDIKWSIERMLKLPRAGSPSFYFPIVGAEAYYNGKANDVAGLKVLDKYTLEVDLVHPYGIFLNVMAMPFAYVLPKEWVTKWGSHFNRHPLGTGQYVMQSWTPGSSMVLKKNPNYFDPTKVYADEWDFDWTPTPTRQTLLVERGDLDVAMNNVPPSDMVRVTADPKWKNSVANSPGINFYYTFYNVNYKPFDNKLVRQACNYAINRDKLAKLYSGAAVPLNQIYPRGMPGYEANANYYPYDPAKAKQLLAQAGYPNGFSTTYWSLNTDPIPKIVQSIIYDLNAVGIKTSLKLLAESPYWTATAAPSTGISIGFSDWFMDYPDPSDWIQTLFSKAACAKGGMDAGNWWDPRVEALSKQAGMMPAGPQRIALYTKMQQIVMDEAAVDPMYQRNTVLMFSPNVGGFYIHPVWITNFLDYWKQ